jgi:hypothetical protein
VINSFLSYNPSNRVSGRQDVVDTWKCNRFRIQVRWENEAAIESLDGNQGIN